MRNLSRSAQVRAKYARRERNRLIREGVVAVLAIVVGLIGVAAAVAGAIIAGGYYP